MKTSFELIKQALQKNLNDNEDRCKQAGNASERDRCLGFRLGLQKALAEVQKVETDMNIRWGFHAAGGIPKGFHDDDF